MDAQPASWSPQADWNRAAAAALAAAAVFAIAWTVVHFGFYADNHIIDTRVYQRYGDGMVAGHVPYRDFTVEYPPAALPTFVIPSAVLGRGASSSSYDRVFGFLMAVCGAAAVALVAVTLVRDRAGPARLAAGCALAALAPLALGSVLLTRFDLWPAALVAAALAALVSGRDRLALGALALGIAAKIYPLVLLPIFLAWIWRRRGRRAALEALGAGLAVVIVCVVPFLALSPHGVWESSLRQISRPLQIETLASGVLLALHHAAGLHLTMVSSHGSQNLAGSLPDALATMQTVLEALAVLGVWIWFARGPADTSRLFRACAAAVCAFVVFGKVLSPQYLIWLVPLVALVRGRRGLAAGGVLVACLVLTQVWFPYRYWRLVFHFDTAASWLVLVRDLGLVGLLAVLLWPVRRAVTA
ncbi:MAG TPA: glycosyltransferase 87 family protein [Gaiellaceae bacterium]|nr:glycosyltransferase 87 family protein [Gaiellaceae bacterium]